MTEPRTRKTLSDHDKKIEQLLETVEQQSKEIEELIGCVEQLARIADKQGAMNTMMSLRAKNNADAIQDIYQRLKEIIKSQ